MDINCHVNDKDSPKSLDPIKTKRAKFDVSYVIRDAVYVNENWYETRSRRRVYTLSESIIRQIKISYRAELTDFHIKLSHRAHDNRWVNYSRPNVPIMNRLEVFDPSTLQSDPLYIKLLLTCGSYIF